MTNCVGLSLSATVSAGGATLSRSRGGTVEAAHGGISTSFVDHELDDMDELFVRCHPSWLLAIGEHSHTLLSWTPDDPEIRDLPPIARLYLPGYDPGGLHRIGFFDVDEASCLVESEVGFCLVHRKKGLLWEDVHDDQTRRVTSVSNGVIRTDSENGSDIYSLTDGSYVR